MRVSVVWHRNCVVGFHVGNFFRKIWECAILKANFVGCSDNVYFCVFNGLVFGIFCIVMGNNAKYNVWYASLCSEALDDFIYF